MVDRVESGVVDKEELEEHWLNLGSLEHSYHSWLMSKMLGQGHVQLIVIPIIY